MKKEVLKYIKNHFSQDTIAVDKLIVSSFIKKNNLIVRKNIFLKNFIITKNDHNEYKNVINFASYLKKHSFEFDFETLVELFEFVISPSDKIVTGAVYTPKHIRDIIVEEVFTLHGAINGSLKICDMACGCGGFLYTAAKKLKTITKKSYSTIFKKNIYGLDIKEYSITRTKLLLSLLSLSEGEDIEEFHFNLFKGNALSFNWGKSVVGSTGFDMILGNPPYVCSRNIDEESKRLLSNWRVCSSGHPDLYIPFFQIGLENLKHSGVLGYITMNTFYKSVNGRALREYFQEFQYYLKIIDFGSDQVFQTKSTYTCICLIQKIHNDSLQYTKIANDKVSYNKAFTCNIVRYTTLDSYDGWNLQNTELINHIESIGTSFGQRYITRNGIATLKNFIYIFKPIKEDDEYYYLQNGNTYRIEKTICKEIINPNRLIKISDITTIKNKIIFPYFFEGENAKLYPEKYFCEKFPMAYNYLREKIKILAERDKGNGNYENWYAYGRNQSLEKLRNKLFFPHITPTIPNYCISTDEELLFHNGMAVICDDLKELKFLKKIMSSRLFWYYITNTSKPYGSGYFSLSRNYIKKFGIFDFSKRDIDYIIKEENTKKLNMFIESKYKISLV